MPFRRRHGLKPIDDFLHLSVGYRFEHKASSICYQSLLDFLSGTEVSMCTSGSRAVGERDRNTRRQDFLQADGFPDVNYRWTNHPNCRTARQLILMAALPSYS